MLKRFSARTAFEVVRYAFIAYFIVTGILLPRLGWAYSEEDIYSEPKRSAVRLTAGPSYSIWNSVSGFEGSMGVFRRWVPNSPLLIGLELGFGSLGPNAGLTPSSSFILRASPSLIFEFGNYMTGSSVPYVGLSIGPAFLFELERNESGVLSRVPSAGLATFLRPGMRFYLSEDVSLGVETKIGVLRNKLIFSPLTQLMIQL